MTNDTKRNLRHMTDLVEMIKRCMENPDECNGRVLEELREEMDLVMATLATEHARVAHIHEVHAKPRVSDTHGRWETRFR